MSETLNSFHFFFFHREIGQTSLEYMLANINKLIIFMMWILQSYNRSQLVKDTEEPDLPAELWPQNLNDSFDFISDSHILSKLSKHTIGILKENIQKMISFSPLMVTFLDQNCVNWKKDL